jgi:hypothetical protein
VAHACNPSYSGGRDQEDQGSKLAWANSFCSKKKKSPKSLVEWLKMKAQSSSHNTPREKKIS